MVANINPGSSVPPDAEALGLAETPLRQVWRTFRKDRLAMAGACVLVLLIALAIDKGRMSYVLRHQL